MDRTLEGTVVHHDPVWVDLFETPVLKVRLMTYFRQNVWTCELQNVGNGASPRCLDYDTASLAPLGVKHLSS